MLCIESIHIVKRATRQAERRRQSSGVLVNVKDKSVEEVSGWTAARRFAAATQGHRTTSSQHAIVKMNSHFITPLEDQSNTRFTRLALQSKGQIAVLPAKLYYRTASLQSRFAAGSDEREIPE